MTTPRGVLTLAGLAMAACGGSSASAVDAPPAVADAAAAFDARIAADAPLAPDARPAPADAAPIVPDARAPAPDAPPPDAPAPAADAPPPDAVPVATLTLGKAAGATGTGTLAALATGTSCGADCSAGQVAVPVDSVVELTATPAAGSFFEGWDGGGCAGIERTCSVTVSADVTVTARFSIIAHNLVFATSTTFDSGDLGGLAGADAKCAAQATKAGLSGTFKAFLSTSTVDARDRLIVPGTSTKARGFVRMDGRPIFDAVADLATTHRFWYPIAFDENGQPPSFLSDDVWTGTMPDGTKNPFDAMCGDWASTGGSGQIGFASGGPLWFTKQTNAGCASATTSGYSPPRIYCFMVDQSTALAAPPSVAGKLIWTTVATFTPHGGKAAADTLCAAEKPAGVAQSTALLATTAQAGGDLLGAATTYVRPDGVAVGTGAELVAATQSGTARLPTAPWQAGDGTYIVSGTGQAWTGADSDLSRPGTAGSTCDDWSGTGGRGVQGFYQVATSAFWNGFNSPCNTAAQIICVER